jgi:hypothetical protein
MKWLSNMNKKIFYPTLDKKSSTEEKRKFGVSIKILDDFVILRGNLNEAHAHNLSAKLNTLLNTKLTSNAQGRVCSYCGGIGGCYMCDS